jgi:hypothetical protein
VQWNSPKNGSKTNNWTPQPMSATTGAGYKPMNQSMSSPPLSMQTTLQPQMYPQLPPMMVSFLVSGDRFGESFVTGNAPDRCQPSNDSPDESVGRRPESVESNGTAVVVVSLKCHRCK